LIDAALTEKDRLAVTLAYRCGGPSGPLVVELALLRELSFGHRHAAHVVGRTADGDELLARGKAAFDVPAWRDASGEDAPPAPYAALGFLRMGFEHILAGVDHLIFLFGVVLVGRRLRSMAVAITAFTVGHSLALALAVLHVASPRSALVEPAIALSIAYVGVENLWLKAPDRRWRITFPFGLVHGFGFAGALAEVAIPAPQIPVALLSFNAGVEVGQLLMLAAFFPVIVGLRRFDVVARRAVPALSALVVAAGIGFFIDRAWTAIHSVAPIVLALGAK
jgi:hydrogenase/urease accessory protein HupE